MKQNFSPAHPSRKIHYWRPVPCLSQHLQRGTLPVFLFSSRLASGVQNRGASERSGRSTALELVRPYPQVGLPCRVGSAAVGPSFVPCVLQDSEGPPSWAGMLRSEQHLSSLRCRHLTWMNTWGELRDLGNGVGAGCLSPAYHGVTSGWVALEDGFVGSALSDAAMSLLFLLPESGLFPAAIAHLELWMLLQRVIQQRFGCIYFPLRPRM
ncbi:uncharacterized protein LOC119508494 [Choloepus didactylus]|uniref:uncharacterized protein LOC119508494 n=1 Tax=Choloepus didactylus TaxID=27675 RepID=UPI00189C7DFA|nr:uncharacterized protein LOC119508494 [Choloepus didactylus]